MPPGPVPVRDSLIGLEFSHYRILERIGSGGMGVVYRVEDAHLEREVAIKVLKPGTITDEHSRKRFRNEAHALSKLNHPNVATVRDFETFDGQDFLIMEFIQGTSLADKLAQGPLEEDEIRLLAGQLCEGLSAAHAHGVVHRDLKPSNLRLRPDNRMKILDFGSRSCGRRRPMRPAEQLSGEQIDPRTDIYATGLILYEMATGQRPYAELHSSKLIGAILRQPPIPPSMLNPKVSPELERVIGRCMEKAAENRYQSARELAGELRQCGKGMHMDSTTITVGEDRRGVSYSHTEHG
jgi:serine/threonine protein kinase